MLCWLCCGLPTGIGLIAALSDKVALRIFTSLFRCCGCRHEEFRDPHDGIFVHNFGIKDLWTIVRVVDTP